MVGLNQYRNYQVETAGPEDRVVMLYDGITRFANQALAALGQENYEQVSINTGKAQRILEELSITLNFEAGGPIAQNLWRLYDYWSWRLGQGLIKQDAEAYREVAAAVADMREAWAEAARQVRAQRPAQSHG